MMKIQANVYVAAYSSRKRGRGKKANDYLAFAMGFSTPNRGHDRINSGFRPVGSPFMATWLNLAAQLNLTTLLDRTLPGSALLHGFQPAGGGGHIAQ